MNNAYIKFIILFSLISGIVSAQESITTKYYKVNLPPGTTAQPLDSIHEELADIKGFVFKKNGKPKYMMIFMSNKSNVENLKVDMDNYKGFLIEYGNPEILALEKFKGYLKARFITQEKGKEVINIAYMSVDGNILNRIFVMYGNTVGEETFSKEVDDLVTGIVKLRSEW